MAERGRPAEPCAAQRYRPAFRELGIAAGQSAALAFACRHPSALPTLPSCLLLLPMLQLLLASPPPPAPPPPPPPDDFMPDPFDPSAVELMRALSAKAKPAAHIYPFAMFSYGWVGGGAAAGTVGVGALRVTLCCASPPCTGSSHPTCLPSQRIPPPPPPPPRRAASCPLPASSRRRLVRSASSGSPLWASPPARSWTSTLSWPASPQVGRACAWRIECCAPARRALRAGPWVCLWACVRHRGTVGSLQGAASCAAPPVLIRVP